MASVKISQLNLLSTITTDDFVALVDSGSLTTYRSPISSFISVIQDNATVSSSISSSWASSSISSSNAETASYSITSSFAITASYIDVNSFTITNATQADFATSSSWASSSISSSYSETSSFAITSSNAFTASLALLVESASYATSASHSITSSYAITSSNALTASYLSATTNYDPENSVIELSIYPRYSPYDSGKDINMVEVSASSLIVYDVSNNSVKLTDVIETVSRSGTGVGALDTGVFNPGDWYDIWVIYNSGTTAVDCVLSNSGATPRNSSLTLPSGYDYYARIGSVKDESGTIWREYYEYSSFTRWNYRNSCPVVAGIANGYTITHYGYKYPKNVATNYQLNNTTTELTNGGFSVGDIIDLSTLEISKIGWVSNKSNLRIYANNITTPSMSQPVNGTWAIAFNPANFDVNFSCTF